MEMETTTLQLRMQRALDQFGPIHVLAVKMKVGLSTVQRMLKGDYEPTQADVKKNVYSFLENNNL